MATTSAEHCTTELAEAINTAAADAVRKLARISATPQVGRVSLAQLAKGIRDHPARAGAIVGVEDAATAKPAHLAALATALVPPIAGCCSSTAANPGTRDDSSTD